MVAAALQRIGEKIRHDSGHAGIRAVRVIAAGNDGVHARRELREHDVAECGGVTGSASPEIASAGIEAAMGSNISAGTATLGHSAQNTTKPR